MPESAARPVYPGSAKYDVLQKLAPEKKDRKFHWRTEENGDVRPGYETPTFGQPAPKIN